MEETEILEYLERLDFECSECGEWYESSDKRRLGSRYVCNVCEHDLREAYESDRRD